MRAEGRSGTRRGKAFCNPPDLCVRIWRSTPWRWRVEPSTRRRRPHRRIHHSDRGGQDLCIRYSQRLAVNEIVASVGSKGDSFDHGMAELRTASLMKAHVRGLVHRRSAQHRARVEEGADGADASVSELVPAHHRAWSTFADRRAPSPRCRDQHSSSIGYPAALQTTQRAPPNQRRESRAGTRSTALAGVPAPAYRSWRWP